MQIWVINIPSETTTLKALNDSGVVTDVYSFDDVISLDTGIMTEDDALEIVTDAVKNIYAENDDAAD